MPRGKPRDTWILDRPLGEGMCLLGHVSAPPAACVCACVSDSGTTQQMQCMGVLYNCSMLWLS
jgi:hypothetical protein